MAGVKALELPYDVVSSEFLTMENTNSAAAVRSIYVKDFLSRYDADPLRY